MVMRHSGDASSYYALTGFPHCSRSITPNDSTDLQNYSSLGVAMHVVVYGAGTIVVIPAGNADASTDTYTVSANAAEIGFVLPVLVRRVLLTGTTATVIKGYF